MTDDDFRPRQQVLTHSSALKEDRWSVFAERLFTSPVETKIGRPIALKARRRHRTPV
jgi:hypothetical protein